MNFKQYHEESTRNFEKYWLNQANHLRWFTPPAKGISEDNEGKTLWFDDGKTNLCYLSIDKHIEDGYGDQTALIYDSSIYQQKISFTYNEIKEEVERLAGGLVNLGVTPGDTVMLYMPMIPQTVFGILACARIGAVHNIIYTGFKTSELSSYIDKTKPKVIITATSGIEKNQMVSFKPILDDAITKSVYKPNKVILFNRKLGTYKTVQKYDVDYHELIKTSPNRGCEILNSSHPSVLSFTVETEKKQKRILRDTGGYATSLSHAMQKVYGVNKNDIFLTSFNLDTTIGTGFGVYAPLINRCCTVIYEGDSINNIEPDEVWRLIEEHNINHFLACPSVFRNIKNKDPKGEIAKTRDLSSLKNLFCTGERFEQSLFDYITTIVSATVSNQLYMSEAGCPVIAHCMGFDTIKPTVPSIGKPVPGYAVELIPDKNQKTLIQNNEGVFSLKLPTPPGFTSSYDNENLFLKKHLMPNKGYFTTSYAGYEKEGIFYISGLYDDHILVSGHLISATLIESTISKHHMIYECAVVGLENGETGNSPVAIVALKNEYEFYDSIVLEEEIKKLTFDELGSLAVPYKVYKVKQIPHDKDGFILRDTIRKMLNGKNYNIPNTIENIEAFNELIDKFRRVKIGTFNTNNNQIQSSLKKLAERYYHIDSLAKYIDIYRISQNDPVEFWDTIAKNNFYWRKNWDNVLHWNKENNFVKWFEGAKLNITENCLDRHLEDKAHQTAIIWEPNDPNDPAKHITYGELAKEVNKMANVLKTKGIQKGDRVCVYLPMIPQLAVTVLACARIGAIHSVVFAGFSATALATRINDAECKMVITSDGALRGNKTIDLKAIVDEALKDTHSVENVLVVKHLDSGVPMRNGRDLWLENLLDEASDKCEAEEMDAEDTLFILYTSGSTGKPKGIVHTTAGYMVYSAYTFQNVFQYKPGDIYWCTADIGWITGHSYIVYGPLLNGATTLMFEGAPSYPDFGRFWEIVDKHKVTQFYTAPTAIRSLAKQSLEFVEKYDLSTLKILGSVGEPINEEAWHWYNDHVGKKRCPIADTWWQTETGGIMIAPIPFATPTKPTYATLPLPGIFPILMGEDKKEITANSIDGHLCISYPWPGMARTIYGNHERYIETYFSAYQGKYFTGDGAFRDEVGYYRITGRVDDVIIVSGHNLGTAPIEDAINEHPAVSESAIVGFPHDIKGNALYGYVILRDENRNHDNVRKEINQIISDKIGPIAKLDKIQIVPGLPRTRSGKIMRRILRKIASHDTSNLGDTSTLLNPEIVQQIIDQAL